MLEDKSAQTEALSFDVATAAIKGARAYQEDSVISSFPVGQNTGFAVLADGMGGHSSGNVASAIVMSEVFSYLKMREAMLEDGILDIPMTLHDATGFANQRVSEHAMENRETFGMGATLLAPVIAKAKLYWVSVGDSPLFLFRAGTLRQLNKDHSMAPQIDMMVKTGAMTAEAGRHHPERNTLTSAITGENIDKIDCPTRPIALLPNDIVVASSDGLQFLSNERIARTLKLVQRRRSVDIANALIAAIYRLDDPDQDNTAFVVIKLGTRLGYSTALDAENLSVVATTQDGTLSTEQNEPTAKRVLRRVTLRPPDPQKAQEANAREQGPEAPGQPKKDRRGY